VLAVLLMSTQQRRLRAATVPHDLTIDTPVADPVGAC
jgi:hypothetical protein